MRHLLFIIGDDLIMNEPFKAYLVRSYEGKFGPLAELRQQPRTDKDLPFLLENLFLQYDFITIIASPAHYPTTAKILATLNEDSLVLEEGALVPKNSLFAPGSFLVSFGSCRVNALRASAGETLPVLLGEVERDFEYFCLFGLDEEDALILLDPLAKSYELGLRSSKLLDQLSLIRASTLARPLATVPATTPPTVPPTTGSAPVRPITPARASGLEGFVRAARQLFGDKFLPGHDPLAFIIASLKRQGLKISLAESCTGGLLASMITGFEGASEIFEGSVVSYSNRLKHEWLGISQNILAEGGEYSEAAVYFMLKGIFKISHCDFALAISGHAGVGQRQGEVFLGAMYKDGGYIQERLALAGDRALIRERASLAAACLLLKLRPEFFRA